MDIKTFYNYAVHILRPKNTEIGETELNNAGDKSQDKNELVINNTIISKKKLNHLYDSGFCHPLPGQLRNVTWMNFNPLHFLKTNNITVTIKKGIR